MTEKKTDTLIADNRKAKYNYEIVDTIEAGIALTGTEVKSLRIGKSTISESYAECRDGNVSLINSYIPEYAPADRSNHPPRRPRVLLLHRREIARLEKALRAEGTTLVPMKFYFNERGRAKILLAIAKGKKLFDKRETIKKREWDRQKSRLMKTQRT